jgi:hypothetical protein
MGRAAHWKLTGILEHEFFFSEGIKRRRGFTNGRHGILEGGVLTTSTRTHVSAWV